MRDICAQARLTDRYFYESFRNTEEAFDAVYRWQMEQLVLRISEAMQEAPRNIEELARSGLRTFYEFIQADPRRAQVLLIDAFSANQHTLEKTQQAMQDYVTLINNFALMLYPRLKQGFNMEMLTWGLLGMAIQVGTNWARDGFRQPIDDVLAYNLYAWQGLEAWITRIAAAAARKAAT